MEAGRAVKRRAFEWGARDVWRGAFAFQRHSGAPHMFSICPAVGAAGNLCKTNARGPRSISNAYAGQRSSHRMDWHQKRGASALLRMGGLGILAIAWAAGTALARRAATPGIDSDPLAYFLAVVTFLGGSFGSVVTVLGRHIFDRVEIARRWSRTDRG
jgi:hypothetical protein